MRNDKTKEFECCNNCIKMVELRQNDGTVRKKCRNDIDGIGVNGFHWCVEYVRFVQDEGGNVDGYI